MARYRVSYSKSRRQIGTVVAVGPHAATVETDDGRRWIARPGRLVLSRGSRVVVSLDGGDCFVVGLDDAEATR